MCLSNVRQIATASLVYECDAGRLPRHVNEQDPLPPAAAKSWCIKSGQVDGRSLYAPYMNANLFRCPEVPALDYHGAAAAHQFSNYLLLDGFAYDFDSALGWHGERFTRSHEPPKLTDGGCGSELAVLVADKLYRDDAGCCVVNHVATDGFELVEMNTPTAYGTAMRRTGLDRRTAHEMNIADVDGSAARYQGDDGSLVDLPDRSTGRFMLPQR